MAPNKFVIKKKIAHYWSNAWGDSYQQDTFLWTWHSEYDQAGNIIRHEEADKNWSIFKYDQNDSLVYYQKTIKPKPRKGSSVRDASPLLDSVLIEISRDDLGLRNTFTQTQISHQFGERKVKIEQVKYKHDTQNRKTESLHVRSDGSEELKTYKYENRRRITRANYKGKDKKDLCASVDTSFFDKKGFIVKVAQASNCNPFKSRQFYRCNNCWIYRSYDDNGNLFKSLRISFAGDTISGYERKFDARNEVVWSESFNEKGEKERNEYEVEEELNGHGDCTFFKVTENGEVLRAEKFEYEYW